MTQALQSFAHYAEQIGCRSQRYNIGSKKTKLNTWCSSPLGGCGLEGCNCSPGLWVSIADKDNVITAFANNPSQYKKLKACALRIVNGGV